MLARTRHQQQQQQVAKGDAAAARQKRAALDGAGNQPKRTRAAFQDVTNQQAAAVSFKHQKHGLVAAKKPVKPVAKRAEQFVPTVDDDENAAENGRPPARRTRSSTQGGKPPAPTGRAPIAKINFAISSSSEDVSAASAMSVSQLASVLGAAGLRSGDGLSPATSLDGGQSDPSTVECGQPQSDDDDDDEYDYDKEVSDDPLCVPVYAKDIFQYYLHRETSFSVTDYINSGKQPQINEEMRTIVVDWMVEIQESFEANHETLYQAVKMFDLYMSRAGEVNKDDVQLVAAVALFISAKFDERLPPALDDFLYVCDDAYSRDTFLRMEMDVLKRLQFDIGWPLSYRYLRRFAKLTNTEMADLTLARYILETSLLHYEFIFEPESKLAAAAFLLALKIKAKNDGNPVTDDLWTPLHRRATLFGCDDLCALAGRLNARLRLAASPSCKTVTVRTKYSHDVFFEVSKMAPLSP